jgi:hypothetical protein
MMPSKIKFRLSNSASFGLANIVVLNDVEFLVDVVFALVTDTDQHKDVFGTLPNSVEGNLNFGDVVGDTDLLRKLVHHHFSFGVISYFISLKLPLVVMSRLKPRHH